MYTVNSESTYGPVILRGCSEWVKFKYYPDNGQEDDDRDHGQGDDHDNRQENDDDQSKFKAAELDQTTLPTLIGKELENQKIRNASCTTRQCDYVKL